MNKTIIFYMDDKGNEVPKEEATKMNIVEFDENGNRINETYMVAAKPKKQKEAKKSYSEEDLMIDESIISSIEWNLPPESIIDELLGKQKKR